ncbi:hypothetical protein CCHOA_03145 [Corynebacterium choanae]|uniref:Uncharacterized protein n=1 Tax=Corynebacterium choanae TaxID=1862358 RepID=A0A3G6J588_9CORY|nr:hypothetical protein CCHOA_03145 [Corynebacterium choanae]
MGTYISLNATPHSPPKTAQKTQQSRLTSTPKRPHPHPCETGDDDAILKKRNRVLPRSPLLQPIRHPAPKPRFTPLPRWRGYCPPYGCVAKSYCAPPVLCTNTPPSLYGYPAARSHTAGLPQRRAPIHHDASIMIAPKPPNSSACHINGIFDGSSSNTFAVHGVMKIDT